MADALTEILAGGPGAGKRPPGRAGVFVAHEIPVERITPDPEHPRTELDAEALERLARSLLSHGQIQPITVRHGDEPFQYVIVTGERRWRAAVLAGLPTLAAVVLAGPKGASPVWLETRLVENALREDLSPMDQARAFRTLMDHNGWSARQLAAALNLHHATVSRTLTLLDLPAPVQDDVDAGRLAPSVAAEVARVDDPDRQTALAARAVSEKLSRAEVVEAVRGRHAPGSPELPDDSPTRRVFRTSTGRVTVELDQGSGPDAILEAFLEAAQNFQAEVRARTIPADEPDPASTPAPQPRPQAPPAPRVRLEAPARSDHSPAPVRSNPAAVVRPEPTATDREIPPGRPSPVSTGRPPDGGWTSRVRMVDSA